MSQRAARHEMADRPFVGTPRPLPQVLFCHVPTRWCGRHWTANTMEDYHAAERLREVHQKLCASTKKDLV